MALGLVLCVGLSFAVAVLGREAIASTLYGVSAVDPLSYAGVVTLVTVVSALAMLVPAWRATRVDPVATLRAE